MKNKEEAVGGNFKLKGLKVFGSKENLFFNEKKYRKVFDETESRYIYCEFAFYNKLFDEAKWDAEVKLVCLNAKTNKEICELKKNLTIPIDQNIFFVREGWGTPEPGWWKKGKYRWKVFVADEFVGETFFYITDGGLVTEDKNPYFSIKEVKLFESPKEGKPLKDRTYLKNFGVKDTKYINLEMTLDNSMLSEALFPLELQFNFYNDSGQHKAYMEYFREITDKRKRIVMDTGYGAQGSGYWYKDKYTLEVLFMDQLIAIIPFEVKDKNEGLDGKTAFLTSGRMNKEDETGEPTKPTFEQAKTSLEALIGLKSVKEQINELSTYLQFIKLRKEKGFREDSKLNLHSLFLGNPGTGKTTVAHMLGQIYYSLDLLEHGKVHEVGRAELVGEYIGQTAPKVKKAIDKARGGILFIDEAYALTDRGDDGKDFGKEVIEVLIKELSDGAGDVAIVFAGYPKEMENFLNANPGLSSRIRNRIHFPDYTPNELIEISKFAARKGRVLMSDDALAYFHKKIVEVYRNRDNAFGNARFINGVMEEAKQNMALRLMKEHPSVMDLSKRILSTLDVKDLRKVFRKGQNNSVQLPIDEALLTDAIAQLKGLIGLDKVKREVDEMAKLVRYYREIGKDVRTSFSIHTVFKGNPGTGKTTLARTLVQIYKALGILEKGHLVEVDRRDLVAGFVGQTALKTGEIIDNAIGGGLFIDEAYALSQGGKTDFGREAIETLLKRMEDQRGQFMVIVAGYPKEMDNFLEANPGLMSRFDKQFIFEDYNTEQLISIAKLMFAMEDLELNAEAMKHLKTKIDKLIRNKHKYFGNARTIRKIVEQAIRQQHLRMANLPATERTEEMVVTITVDDVKDFNLMEDEVRRGIGFGR